MYGNQHSVLPWGLIGLRLLYYCTNHQPGMRAIIQQTIDVVVYVLIVGPQPYLSNRPVPWALHSNVH